LQSSTSILANNIDRAPENINSLEQYVIGDMRVVPNVKSEYIPGQNLVPYMQIYGMEFDQSTQNPSLEIEFAIKGGGKVLETIPSSAENSELFYYGQRVVLAGRISTGNLSPGNYQLEIKVLDKISTNRLITTTDFIVKEAPVVVLAEEEEEE
ncbi:MAG: hypothetical protein LBJ21_08080, partial [Acidobacteriota bacterium]|nr:hypothetical protein [Acidobacteriota bacterium]